MIKAFQTANDNFQIFVEVTVVKAGRLFLVSVTRFQFYIVGTVCTCSLGKVSNCVQHMQLYCLMDGCQVLSLHVHYCADEIGLTASFVIISLSSVMN